MAGLKIQAQSINPSGKLSTPGFSLYKGVALVFIDASFRKSNGKCCFGFSIWLNSNIVRVRSMESPNVSSPKEARMRSILASPLKVKEWGFNNILVLSDALEVVRTIKGTSYWSINSILFDIKDVLVVLIS